MSYVYILAKYRGKMMQQLENFVTLDISFLHKQFKGYDMGKKEGV